MAKSPNLVFVWILNSLKSFEEVGQELVVDIIGVESIVEIGKELIVVDIGAESIVEVGQQFIELVVQIGVESIVGVKIGAVHIVVKVEKQALPKDIESFNMSSSSYEASPSYLQLGYFVLGL